MKMVLTEEGNFYCFLQTKKRKTSFPLLQKETENGSFLGQQTINGN
jgi:hypothetical protein